MHFLCLWSQEEEQETQTGSRIRALGEEEKTCCTSEQHRFRASFIVVSIATTTPCDILSFQSSPLQTNELTHTEWEAPAMILSQCGPQCDTVGLPCCEGRSGRRRGSTSAFIPYVANCLDRMGAGMCHTQISWLKPTSQMVLRWLRGQDLYHGRCSGCVNTTCIWQASAGNALMMLNHQLLSDGCINIIMPFCTWWMWNGN